MPLAMMENKVLVRLNPTAGPQQPVSPNDPRAAARQPSQEGTVVLAGVRFPNITAAPTLLPGTVVCFSSWSGDDTVVNGEHLLVMSYQEIHFTR